MAISSRGWLGASMAVLTLGATPVALGRTAQDRATPQTRADGQAATPLGAPVLGPSVGQGRRGTTSPIGPPESSGGPAIPLGGTIPPGPGVLLPGALTPSTPELGAASGLGPSLSSGLGGGASGGGSYFGMLGDQGPTLSIRQATPALPTPFPPGGFPKPPSPRLASALAPSVRGFKIGENQSPQPQDRLFYSFNYFANLNASVNRNLDAPVNNLRAYREIFGFEKTFNDGKGSFGIRLPLNTITANSTLQGTFNKPGGTSTALGDLSLFAKYVLEVNPETGSLASVGVVVTPPTGPDAFGGAKYLQGVHSTTVQPFIGYLINRGRFYLHGFAAIDVPSSLRDVTTVYNDLGIGYYVMRSSDPDRFLTAIAPTLEAHVNTPLTHRGAFRGSDISATADVVNLTYGVNFEFYRRSVLTLGFVTPVTGPRPFDYEALVLFNVRFGRRRARPAALPILGG